MEAAIGTARRALSPSDSLGSQGRQTRGESSPTLLTGQSGQLGEDVVEVIAQIDPEAFACGEDRKDGCDLGTAPSA